MPQLGARGGRAKPGRKIGSPFLSDAAECLRSTRQITIGIHEASLFEEILPPRSFAKLHVGCQPRPNKVQIDIELARLSERFLCLLGPR